MRMQARINTETATIGALQKPAARLKIATFSGEKPARMKCQNCMLRTSCLAKTSRASDMEILNDVALHPTPAHKGDYFYHQEDNFKSLFIVRSGAVKTYHVDKQGQEHITGFYLPGELFGSDGLANGRHRNFAQALDTSAICEIPYQQLEQSFQDSPDLQRRLVQMLSADYLDRQQPLLFLHHKQVEERLATFITGLSSRYAELGLSATEFALPMSRRDIAHYLGMTEETLSRLFSRFNRMGLMSGSKRTVNISDMDGLDKMALEL